MTRMLSLDVLFYINHEDRTFSGGKSKLKSNVSKFIQFSSAELCLPI